MEKNQESIFVKKIGNGPSVVLLHGFTQNHSCWGEIPSNMEKNYQILLVDLPGHGHSKNIHANLEQSADLVAQSLEPCYLIGYSMGARVGLHLGLRYPHLIKKMILIGPNPGLVDNDQKAQRIKNDQKWISIIEQYGVEEFLNRWLSQPLFKNLSPTDADIEARRSNSASGLISSLKLCGLGQQKNLWQSLHQLEMPILVVAGQKDEKFVDIGKSMVAQIGHNAQLSLIKDATHAAHLEKPEEFTNLANSFLTK